MAQAARLNLRMQKELKLLLTDPPPGSFFPFLSTNSDFSSLSTIDARIEGPEGSVYAKGIFSIKIQIPDRYPFQPPSVTFATPIYHPNIDNGGRICLDILNLPPKGAWQPSLNISTVLTSIGLLLSEPNPDDGLMCEPSREYKYNRQVFDQKARAMTEKYAKPGANLGSCSTQYVKRDTNSSTMMEAKGSDKESTKENKDFISNSKKPCGISGVMLDEYNVKYETPSSTVRKLSLDSSVRFLEHNKMNINPKQSQSCPETAPTTSLDLPVLHIGNCSEQGLHQLDDKMSVFGNKSRSSEKSCQVSRKKLSLGFKASSQGQEKDDEKNIVPSHKFPFSNPRTAKKTGNSHKLSLGPLTQLQGSNEDNNRLLLHSQNLFSDALQKQQSNQHQSIKIDKGTESRVEESPVAESVIVLDSEDSEEEINGPVSSKLSLVRKCMKKRKSYA